MMMIERIALSSKREDTGRKEFANYLLSIHSIKVWRMLGVRKFAINVVSEIGE